MINSIPTSLMLQLNINISSIPATNLPNSFLQKHSRDVLKSNTLDTINDMSALSKIIPGIKLKDLEKIPTEKVLETLKNIISASSTYGIDLSSSQVIIFLEYISKSLKFLKNTNL